MAIDETKLERLLLEQRADMMVMRGLVSTLIDAVQNRAVFVERFRSLTESYESSAPPGTDAELLIEIRLRASVWLKELQSPYLPI